MQEYFILFGKHMKSSVLRHLPPEFNQLAKQSTASEARDMIPQPDLASHVFCQVLADCGAVELDEHGWVFLLPFSLLFPQRAAEVWLS